jgi:hypothetical protein
MHFDCLGSRACNEMKQELAAIGEVFASWANFFAGPLHKFATAAPRAGIARK